MNGKLFVSLHVCPKCQGQLTFDAEKETLTCQCGSTHAKFVNLGSFREATS